MSPSATDTKDHPKGGANPSHHLPFHKHVLAGALAGLVEVCCMYPLDLVKTRFQLNTGNARSAGVIATFREMIRTEGFLNLYRGIASPIMAEAPKRAIKFSSNEQYKKLLANAKGQVSNTGFVIAGAMAGITEAIINCPFELVKVRMQAKENLNLYKNTADAAKSIFRVEGITGLYSGLFSMFWRNGVWNGVYFGTINLIKKALPEPQSYGTTMGRNFLAGFISGTLATIANNPFDVVKSRIQNTLPNQTRKYRLTLPALATITREEGLPALYKGFVPKVLRLGPGGGIMLVAFDLFSALLA